MYVHKIDLETRAQGSGIATADGDLGFTANVRPGATVTLRFREVRIIAQILEIEQDLFFIGQVIDFDGNLEPEIQGVSIGSYLRFREKNIFACYEE